MKKIYSLALLMAAGVTFGQTFDSFTSTGDLIDNGWTHHSGSGIGQIEIMTTASDNGNSLSFAGLAASTGNRISIVAGNNEDVNKPFTTAITSGSAYYSALIKVQNTTGLNANNVTGDYFLGLTVTTGNGVDPNPEVTSFYGRLYVKKGTADNTVNIGVLNTSGGTATPSYVATDFAVNTTLFVVVKYDFASNTATLWVNPTPGGSEVAGTANATGSTAAATTLGGIFIRQGGNATAGTGNVEIDEMRVGETYASVTPATTAGVKESAIAGLKVYPNPLKGNVLNITSDANATKAVAIFDVLGKQVVNTKTANTSINVSSLTSGVYIVKITEEGKTATKKLVVQ
ncbi:T9SS type A sorting domain-containing protein [uncultured Flavobacterium sp.]|uniref:T9SS type A sorting domain-containing protein n=1 Tax=uncultured Flavobacterium sp. TaxID=165435 RepID=UPI0025CD8185|nr:T9SS type A sorting domain-containing protein [uncultured Flavobacterium sp.]